MGLTHLEVNGNKYKNRGQIVLLLLRSRLKYALCYIWYAMFAYIHIYICVHDNMTTCVYLYIHINTNINHNKTPKIIRPFRLDISGDLLLRSSIHDVVYDLGARLQRLALWKEKKGGRPRAAQCSSWQSPRSKNSHQAKHVPNAEYCVFIFIYEYIYMNI